MTDTQPPVPPTAEYSPAHPTPPQAVKGKRNIVGIIALVVAVVGFIFACIPGALVLGWILLPVGLIMGIVAVCLKGKVKWQGITAIIVSVVGTIVGFVVFSAVVVASLSTALNGNVEVTSPDEPGVVAEESEDSEPAEDAEEAPAAQLGTRENPIPLGTAFSSDEWTVVVNSVTLDAADQIVTESMINDEPDAGTEYLLINYTVTYTGDDADGQMPALVQVDYVTGDGVTVDSLDKILVAPDAINVMATLYTDASATGNEALQVPTPADGVLAIRPGMFADKVFVAIK